MKTFSLGEYREAFGPNHTRSETNWEPDIGEPQSPPMARTIAVTPEMQARDAAECAAREARLQTAWSPFRDTLREDNLRKVKRPVAAGRKEMRPAIRPPKPRVPRVAKASPAPKLVAPPIPAPKEIQSTMANSLFTIGDPVPLTTVPSSRTRVGHGAYLPLFTALEELLGKDSALPVTVANRKAGQAVTVGLRKLAKATGLRIKHSRNADFTIFYFHLESAEPAGK